MNSRDLLAAKEFRHGNTPQRNNNKRLQRSNLPIKVVVTGRNLSRQRIAIFGGTALNDIRDKDILTFEIDAL